MTREKSEKNPPKKIFQISGEKLADFLGCGMTATVEPCRPGAAQTVQNGRTLPWWCNLPRPGNGLYKLCTALAIAVLCAAYAMTALESLRKTII